MQIKYSELKKYLIPTVCVFIAITIFNYIFHGMLMEKIYLAHSHLFRPQDEIHKHKYYMWLANLIYSISFCYIYSKGHEKKEDTVAQGLRFGLWISFLVWVPSSIVNYTIFPHPALLHTRWLIGYTVQSIIAGIIAAITFTKSK